MSERKNAGSSARDVFREHRRGVILRRAAVLSAAALVLAAVFFFGSAGLLPLPDIIARHDGTAAAQEEAASASSDGVTAEASDTDAAALSIKEIIKENKPAVVGVVSSLYRGTTLVGRNTGTGIIMTPDGYIVTNAHVVEDSFDPSVVLYDGREFTASVVGRDRKSDLAVLKIEAKGLTCAEFGNSDAVEEGDLAVAIGPSTTICWI